MSEWGDLSTPAGLGLLNAHLANESYVVGVTPSKDDTLVFSSLGSMPDPSFVHLARWYNHIRSFSAERRSTWLPGKPVPLVAGQLSTTNSPIFSRKSLLVLDIKPVSEDTDLRELESRVRAIVIDGLDWKDATFLPIGFGIKKLQISCQFIDSLVIVEDDVVSKIREWDHLVAQVDVHSIEKL